MTQHLTSGQAGSISERAMDPRLRRHSLGYWEVIDKPSGKELEKFYAEKYFQESRGSYQPEYSAEELKYFEEKLEQRYFVLQKYRSAKQPGTMLDVGCGEGYGLAFFRERGWSVKGFDFSSAGIESKNPSCRDALETGNVFELLRREIDSGARYDVIWLQHVLEHVIDPIDLLKALRLLTSPDGIAVVTVPNDCSIIQRGALAQKHIDEAFWVDPPEHLSYFDEASLRKAVAATGWICLETLADFPIDWFYFHPGSNYVRDKRLGKAAHRARMQIESLIHGQPVEDAVRFWSSAAKVGIGRNITAFIRPTTND